MTTNKSIHLFDNFAQMRKEIEATRVEIASLRSTLNAKENYLNELNLKLERAKERSSTLLSNDEKTRYSRQLILPGFGIKSQEKLKRFAVLIVGVGGLGCPAAQYLAAAGIGKLGFVDYDEVERTNLHRQILHNSASVGLSKAESARRAVQEINPYTKVHTYNELANSSNIIRIINDQNYDIVLDCSDNVATRYLLNDACVILKRPLVSGSALQLDGQLTVYHYGECSPCYRCLFPVPPPPEAVTNCGDGGVLGAVTGVVGTLQALEAIKIATQLGEVLAGRMLIYDGALCKFRSIKLRGRRVDCNICAVAATHVMLEDYEQFCGMRASDRHYALDLLQEDQRLSVQEYQKVVQNTEDHLLIDVRSPTEFDICKLPNSLNVPLKDVLNDAYMKRFENELNNPEMLVVVLCRRGNDSQIAVQHMRNRFPQHNIRDIAGGLHAWHFEIDKDFPIY